MPNLNAFAVALFLGFLVLGACGGSSPGSSSHGASKISELTNPAATMAMACSGCHAAPGGAIVALDGYDEETLRDTLSRYRSETDGTTVMHRLARGYSDDDIDLLSQHLAETRDGE